MPETPESMDYPEDTESVGQNSILDSGNEETERDSSNRLRHFWLQLKRPFNRWLVGLGPECREVITVGQNWCNVKNEKFIQSYQLSKKTSS